MLGIKHRNKKYEELKQLYILNTYINAKSLE